MASGKGLLAADESLPTIGRRFAPLGIPSTAETRRVYRELLLTTPGLDEFISGVILFDETIQQKMGGMPAPDALNGKGIIPGIKVDLGTTPLPGFPASKSPRDSTGCANGSPPTGNWARASPSGAR